MPWYKVTFDLDRDQPPGIEPQIAIAQRTQEAFDALGQPEGFAVYDLNDFESNYSCSSFPRWRLNTSQSLLVPIEVKFGIIPFLKEPI